MKDKVNIILTGVGGQGVLLMAELLGISALIEGLDVRVSEIHGMAQRGGSVLCHVRLGKKVYAPTIMEGAADIVVGLEPLETLRTIKYMSNKTLVLINIEPIKPYATTIGLTEYPKIEKILSEKLNNRTITQESFYKLVSMLGIQGQINKKPQYLQKKTKRKIY